MEGALLEAGGNGGGIVFESAEGCCGVGGVERRLSSGGHRLNSSHATNAGGDGFFGGGGRGGRAVRHRFEGVGGFEGFDSCGEFGDGGLVGGSG